MKSFMEEKSMNLIELKKLRSAIFTNKVLKNIAGGQHHTACHIELFSTPRPSLIPQISSCKLPFEFKQPSINSKWQEYHCVIK